jgi:hypothetical protein
LSEDYKYLVIVYDAYNKKGMGFYFKKTLKEAQDFAKKVSSNGFSCYIYENNPTEIHKS